MNENEISNAVMDCAIKVHKVLGPGLLESVYQRCLEYELTENGLFVEFEKILPVNYEGIILSQGYRVDLMVENKVIIEVKSVENLHDVHKAQLLTYLKLSGCRLGLLINFNVKYVGLGFKRVINGVIQGNYF